MDTQKIGKLIAQKRKELHLTQAQLSEQLGVTSKTVSRWENGNYMPDLSLLLPLSQLLKIDVNELLCGELSSPDNHQELPPVQPQKASLKNIIFIGIIFLLLLSLYFLLLSISPYHLDRLRYLILG